MTIPGPSYRQQAVILIFLLAVATTTCDAKRAPQVVGPDPFRNKNLANDWKPLGETIFNVMNYGAVPDGKKDSTQAFMQTWVAACHNHKGSARVLVPIGTFLISEVVFAGPCGVVEPIIFQIDGTLLGTTDISEYSSNEWILFEKISGLVVTGRGTLNAQGEVSWKYNDCTTNSGCVKLPVSLKFNNINHGIVKGLNLVNSKGFHMFITNCENFRARKLHITAPRDSPNTDGIHLSNSNNVKIAKSVISTGDDCISIGQGSTRVSITKIKCGPGHGISVGSLGKYQNEADVNGILVNNCTLVDTDNGLRIKTWADSPPSAAGGILFQNIIMDSVRNPVLIDQEYSCGQTCNKPPSRVRISDVHFVDVRGTTDSELAVHLKCSKQFPCQNVDFFNVDLKYSGIPTAKSLPFGSLCINAKVTSHGILNPPPCK